MQRCFFSLSLSRLRLRVEKCFKNCFRLNEHKATLQRIPLYTPLPPIALLCTRYAHGLQALALFLTWRAATAAAASPASFQLVLIAQRRENKAKLKLYTCCCCAGEVQRGGGVAMPFCSMCKSQLSLVLNFYDETRRLSPSPPCWQHCHFVCRGKPNDSNSSAL